MKVTWAAPPFLPLRLGLDLHLDVKLDLDLELLKATALDVAILAGHALLYPSGIVQERLTAAPTPQAPAPTPQALPLPDPDPDSEAAPAPGPRPGPDLRPGHTPVVLLHGFIDNRSVFVLLRRSLAQHGRRQVVPLNFSPLTRDIRRAAELLGRRVEEICERTGSRRVDIVGHSLGGLIARYYAQRLGGDLRVRTLVTLGTPHAGTRVLPLADAHPVMRQMRPGSAVIEELSRPAPNCRTRFVSFWSDLDRAMDPLETARLDHPDLAARNVRVSGVGHLALPLHPAVATGIRQALDAPDPAPDPAPDSDVGPAGLTVA
ncbi:esterase/lipase family protein [Streptomyces ziwulingensis]|uniref:Alpha/beta fold hydrolase n=1 Tax=Streptomyces ziwulingensis TaxID=1045501 RepID=A0ABP9CFH8_9ACTN